MTAKEYLRRVSELEHAIGAKQRELDGLHKNAASLNGVTYGGDKVIGGGVSDPMKIIDKISDLEAEINREIDLLVDMKEEVRNKISRVYNPDFIALLTDRYINGLTLEKISERMDKSYETIKCWHGQALQIFRRENHMT